MRYAAHFELGTTASPLAFGEVLRRVCRTQEMADIQFISLGPDEELENTPVVDNWLNEEGCVDLDKLREILGGVEILDGYWSPGRRLAVCVWCNIDLDRLPALKAASGAKSIKAHAAGKDSLWLYCELEEE